MDSAADPQRPADPPRTDPAPPADPPRTDPARPADPAGTDPARPADPAGTDPGRSAGVDAERPGAPSPVDAKGPAEPPGVDAEGQRGPSGAAPESAAGDEAASVEVAPHVRGGEAAPADGAPDVAGDEAGPVEGALDVRSAVRVVEQANAGPVPAGAVRRRSRWGRIAWYAVAGAVIVLLTTLLVWPRQPTDAERQVRAFLTAVQRGDVAAAQRLVDDRPDTRMSSPSFLRSDVLRQRWRVTSVRSDDDADERSYSAEVDATIAVPGGPSVTHRFDLVRESGDGAWRLRDPYVYLTFGTFPVSYVAINGHREKLPRPGENTTYGARYVLFPGVYRFFSSAPAVTHSTRAYPLMPGQYAVRQDDDASAAGPNALTLPRMRLTGSAQRKAQQAVYDYLDDCVRRAKLVTPGCPFGAESVPEPGRPDRIFYGREIKSTRWKLQRHPEVTIEPVGNEFQVVDRRPGTLKLTVTGTDEDTGFHATTSMSCPTRDGVLRVDVTDSGGFRVYPEGGRYGADRVDRSPIRWQTC